MSTTLNCSLGIALSLLTATSASANDPQLQTAVKPIIAAGYISGGNGYGWGWGNAGTAHESFNRGRATLIRSIGERHLLDSEANINNQEAISRQIDNRVKAQQARYAMRRAGEAERNLHYEKIHNRRLTAMALNDAHRILQNPSAANLETRAEARLRLALSLLEKGRQEHAVNWLQEITKEYVNTPAAAEAARILEDINA